MAKQHAIPKNKSIEILAQAEFQEAYFVPKIPQDNKSEVFEIDNILELGNYDIALKIKYILDLGYFRLRKTFFKYTFSEVLDDVSFILRKYFPDLKLSEIKNKEIRRNSLSELRNKILDQFEYKHYNINYDEILIENLKKSYFKLNLTPKQLFGDIITKLLPKYKLTMPEYKRVQKIVSKVINSYEKEIFDNIDNLLSKKQIEEIETILELKAKKESNLSFLKTSARGFAHNAVKEEIEKRTQMQEVYKISNKVLEKLNVSYSTIEYYAKLVESLEFDQIKNWQNSRKYFAILCFVNFRFIKSNDDMVKTFKYLVGNYARKGFKDYKEYLYKNRKSNKELFKKIFELIIFLFENNTWKDYNMETLRDKILDILEIEDVDEIQEVKDLIEKQFLRDTKIRWEIMDGYYEAIKKNIRPVLAQIELTFSDSMINNKTKNVIKFIQDFYEFLKDKNVKVDWEKMPKHLIPTKELKELENNTERIEILIYSKINDWLDKNDVYVKDSIEFKKFEDYLMSWDEYEKEHKQIFEEIGSELLNKPFKDTIISKLDNLDKKYHIANNMILNNEIEQFKMLTKDKWTLGYEKIETVETPSYFEDFRTDIVSLIRFVDKKTGFLGVFEHISHKNVNKEIDKDRVIANILLNATGIEQKDFLAGFENNKLNYKKLLNYFKTRFRNETLANANQIINNFASKLPSFRRYDVKLGYIHSGSDGQKIGSSYDLNIVRHSQKFWGKGKAINHLTMQINHLFASMLVIPANEYEGNSLLELILKNNLDEKPDRHSTDNHGINDLNFGLLELFGYEFCPRYKNC